MKSPDLWHNEICEGIAGHTPDCNCERCKKGEEAFLLVSDIEAIQADARNHERQEADRDYANQIKSLTDDCDRMRSAIDNVYEAANDAKTMAIEF